MKLEGSRFLYFFNWFFSEPPLTQENSPNILLQVTNRMHVCIK